MNKRGIHQVVTGLSYGDAITHHALTIRQALHDRGIPSLLFAEQIGEDYLSIALPLSSLKDSGNDAVLYHYSIHSSATEAVLAHRGPVLLVYHNVTPPHFFYDYDIRYASLLERGRRGLGRFSGRAVFAFADSEYNRRELIEAGFEKTAVLPIIFSPDYYRVAPNRVVKKLYDDNYQNLLVVGRVVPQKRLEHLIRMFAMYRRYLNNKARLIIVGPHEGFEQYLYGLLNLVERLRLGEVHFTGLVPFRELLAYYSSAHMLLSASEHEGFCVPLLEGLTFRLPIVARACGAVPETLGDAGISYSSDCPLELAELVHHVLSNEKLKTILKKQAEPTLRRHAAARSLEIFFSRCAAAGVLS